IVKILLLRFSFQFGNSSSSPFKAKPSTWQRHCTTQCCRSQCRRQAQFPISRTSPCESTLACRCNTRLQRSWLLPALLLRRVALHRSRQRQTAGDARPRLPSGATFATSGTSCVGQLVRTGGDADADRRARARCCVLDEELTLTLKAETSDAQPLPAKKEEILSR
uniref:Ubiquitin-like domain-containing protein n=1 Tax=Macrostomum lignano TaxID=282301 RepID=A0A1I8JMP2_9PLAT